VSFIRCIAAVKKARQSVEGDEGFGYDAIAEALAVPLRTIAENAGEKGTVVVSKVAEMKGNEGFNALTRTYGDLRLTDEEGGITVIPNSTKFIFGGDEGDEIQRVECGFEITDEHWERFMRFMNRYAAANGMGYEDK